jgi:hypothetical protein
VGIFYFQNGKRRRFFTLKPGDFFVQTAGERQQREAKVNVSKKTQLVSDAKGKTPEWKKNANPECKSGSHSSRQFGKQGEKVHFR